jgi:probable phosphoglycerate mutase
VSGPATAGSERLPGDVRARLVLIRHGESTFVAEGRFQGRQDPPLSALGERQAGLAGAWLASPGGPRNVGLDAAPREIVHSPLARAARTAAVIARALERRPNGDQGAGQGEPPGLRSEPALVEISQGDWEGLTQAEVAARWGEQLAAWRTTPTTAWAPGGESLPRVQERVRAALPRLFAPFVATGSPGADAAGVAAGAWGIVVAHDGILRVVLLTLLGLPLEHFWQFPFDLGAATLIDVADGRASLRAHNLGEHLVPARELDPSSLSDRGGAL